jgi:zinc protease
VLPEVDGFEWTLANGMHVILKPTTFTSEQLEFRLVGTGGASLASDADYPSAFLADGVVRATGVGPVSGRQLSRLLDGSSIELNQSVTDDAVSITGDGAPREVETLFQLLHLYFTAARVDSAAFRRYRERARAFGAHRQSDPDAVFHDSVAAVVGSHHPRALRSGPRFFDAVALSRSIAFWNARMSNAANFTLVLTGDFTLDLMRPYVERYLASLPAGVREQPHDDGMRFPAAVVRKDLYVGAGPKAKAELVFAGPYGGTLESSEALSATVDVAELALEERLRETLGATYGVNVTSTVRYAAPMTYRIQVVFEAAPERIDSLVDAALAELARLRTTGPTKTEVEKVRAAKLRDLDDTDDNSYWANELSAHTRMGWPLTSIASHKPNAERLTVDGVRLWCARILDTSHYVRVTMYPKTFRRPLRG